jgi:polyisoprenoid-binding protein YceI
MSPRRFSLLSAALSMVGVGCPNPAQDKPQAVVSAAVPAPAPAGGAATVYLLSPASSRVEWVGAKVTRKHEGSFGQFTGRIELPDGRLENARIAVDIDMASITSDTDRLTGHLKSPDFFDVARFPKASFVSTSVKAGAAAPANYTVEGNLTMRGVTKGISFPATLSAAGTSLKAAAEFGINRKDWGIVYPGMPDDLVAEQVLLRLAIDAPRQ